MKSIEKLVKHFRVDKPGRFDLASIDPADTYGLDLDKHESKAMLDGDVERLVELQQRLYANHRWAVLIVLQGMDASGKDGIIKHVMSGVNPQGCDVHPFKAPSGDELDRDFLWRSVMRLPRRGHIGIFNRSHYEEVLVVRVHDDLLERQKLPPESTGKHLWQHRFKSIRAFERHLAHNGVLVLKFFLHISRKEQRKRFLDRLEEPAKRWKFDLGDISERKLWDKYMACYEDMVRATSRPEAPWHVVPADHKGFARLVVARTIVEALEGLDLHYPRVTGSALQTLNEVRKHLEADDS